MGQVLSLLVENKAGVLSRVVGLFSQRGYNIETLNVAPTQDPTMSRITLCMETDASLTEQVVKQVNKLIDVIKVIPHDPTRHLVRELALVRVRVKEGNRSEILALSETFRARVISANPRSYTFEVTGQSEKIDAFLENVRIYGIQEVHRTGKLALNRGDAAEKQPSARDQSGPRKTRSDKEEKGGAPSQPTSLLEVKTNHG